jgi:L-alanine-DL-glutamate epimerase-like enolase superfamily enzyme
MAILVMSSSPMKGETVPQERRVVEITTLEPAVVPISRINAYLLKSIVGPVHLPDQVGLRNMEISSVLVEVETREGVKGYGESFYRSLEDCRFLAVNVRSLGRHLLGKNALDVQQRWHEMYVQAKRSGGYAAMSALDEALWDIKGKIAGRPVYELLGGKTTPVRPYATFPIDRSSEQLVEDARWLRSNGFLNMKIAVGHGVEQDRRHIRYVAERLPDDFRLAIDANTTYSFEDAFRLGRTASELELLWFEEPVEHLSIERNAELNNRLSVPIAGYQTYNTHYPVVDLLRANALDIYQPSLDYVGGITAAHRVGVLVEAFGKRLVPHTMGPVVNFAASLHVAASQRACTLIELPVLSRDLSDPGTFHAGRYMTNVGEIALQNDGTISPPDRPGLGVELDWDAIKDVEVERLTVGDR